MDGSTPFTLRVENLRALRKVRWSPEGVCALVGANGAGKSTLLQVLRFLNVAVQRGVEEGFRQTFGSSYGLRNRHAESAEEIRVGVELNGSMWWVTLTPRGSSIAWPAKENVDGGGPYAVPPWMRAEGAERVELAVSPSRIAYELGHTSNLAVEVLARRASGTLTQQAAEFVDLFTQLHVYHDPELWSLRTQGSPTTADTILHSRGVNAFAVLRMWNERREHRHRHQFVLDGLQAAFPRACSDLDFESAGQTTFARVWAPDSELPTPIANEANGLLAMLVYLCDIASGETSGLVAIDEPENSLHPHALRELLGGAQAWSEAHGTTIVLATHSPVILNELTGTPDRVWVMRADPGREPNPTRLDELKNPDWLRHFALGTLYINGELGSNDDAA